MDGQIIYIQSSSAPDAVRGCDKSPGGWGGGGGGSGGSRRGENRTERSKGNGVTKRTRHLGGKTRGRKKIKNAAERAGREGGGGEEAVYSVRIEP